MFESAFTFQVLSKISSEHRWTSFHDLGPKYFMEFTLRSWDVSIVIIITIKISSINKYIEESRVNLHILSPKFVTHASSLSLCFFLMCFKAKFRHRIILSLFTLVNISKNMYIFFFNYTIIMPTIITNNSLVSSDTLYILNFLISPPKYLCTVSLLTSWYKYNAHGMSGYVSHVFYNFEQYSLTFFSAMNLLKNPCFYKKRYENFKQ